MTDEMTIQPQRQKSPLVPTAIAGGVGATAGYFGTEWYNRSKGAMSYEELVADVKDKTDFSSKKEPAKWSDFKAKADKVASLEKQIAEMPEKVLAETDPLAIAKKDAQAKFDKRLAELIKAEEAKLGSSTTGKLVLDKQLAETLKVNEAIVLEKELDAYSQAVGNLRGKGGGSAVKTEFNAVETARKEAKTLFNKTSKLLDKDAKKLSETLLVDKNVLKGRKFAEIQKIAQEYGNVYSISSEAVSGGNVFKVQDAFGTGKPAWVSVDNAALKEARKEMVTTIKENARQYKAIEGELKDIATNFLKENQAELKELGITDTAGMSKLKLDKTFNAEILNLSDKIRMAERNGTSSFLVKNPITGVYGNMNLDAAKELLEKAEKKKELVSEYARLTGPKKAAQNALVAGHAPVANARATYQEAVANNPQLKKAIDNIKNKLVGKRVPEANKAEYEAIWNKLQPLLEGEGRAATGTVDKAAIEKLLHEQQVGKDLKIAIEKYEKALAEKGVTNTAAKEALQKELGTVKNEAKKIAEELAHKKLPKGWIALGAGAALALVGFMASSSNKA